MALAVLVLAYREPVILSLVIPLYKRAGFDVYVHLDEKASAREYILAMGESAKCCEFIEARARVFWAGWSMIQATINLMKRATSAQIYDNFLLVSDDTMPIVSSSRLRAALELPIERISARPVRDDEVFADRYRQFFFFDHPATSLLGRPIETSSVDDVLLSTLARLKERRRRGKTQIPLYYGAQWWCLTAAATRTVLASYEEMSDLRESFEFAAVPDEMYIQTLVANFAHTNRIVGGPVYTDWNRAQKPHIFTDFSYEASVIADQVFVRKVSARNREFVEKALLRIET